MTKWLMQDVKTPRGILVGLWMSLAVNLWLTFLEVVR